MICRPVADRLLCCHFSVAYAVGMHRYTQRLFPARPRAQATGMQCAYVSAEKFRDFPEYCTIQDGYMVCVFVKK